MWCVKVRPSAVRVFRILIPFLVTAIVGAGLMSACKITPSLLNPGDVVAAGFTSFGSHVPCYWLGRDETELKGPDNQRAAGEVSSMFVSMDTVYLAGFARLEGENPAPYRGPAYWRLYIDETVGEPVTEFHELAGWSDSWAECIWVDENVYAAGWYYNAYAHRNGACYWRNGVAVDLEPEVNCVAKAIAVANGVVYVGGRFDRRIDENSYALDACYWRNGVRVDLGEGCVYDIAVDGDDVYLAGYTIDPVTFRTTPCYWKNGILVKLDEPLADGVAGTWQVECIYVREGVVYACGTMGTIACYWEDGRRTDLEQGEAHDLCVQGGDVYVTGSAQGNPCYWVNGSRHSLFTDVLDDGESRGIYVKE